MEDLIARTMVENLSIGIHPLTGEALPKQDTCSNEIIQEALKIVLEHCSLESYATIRVNQRKEKESALREKAQLRAERYPIRVNPGPKRKIGSCGPCIITVTQLRILPISLNALQTQSENESKISVFNRHL